MLGAIIGDIVGSTREWHNIKSEDFELLPPGSCFTDDTVMTLAVAEWLMTDPTHSEKMLVECMQRLGRKYPNAGYGGMFRRWLMSDNPQPYGSFGNGSAMRVSPVGMYAKSMEEALELAHITASVTHNHPEGIKGAQAIAACVYMKMHTTSHEEIKHFIEDNFGYDLNVKLEDIREEYTFDVTCQGSVPIAIMAFLQRSCAEKALRLAISMGGDSDTIGCMVCAIANTQAFYFLSSWDLISTQIVEQCRKLLPAELLDINDRFEAFINKPLSQSYNVQGNHRLVFAGEYPGDKDAEKAKKKIEHMVRFGIRHFIDLTEEHELQPYEQYLPSGVTYTRFPIKDASVPISTEWVRRLLDKIAELIEINMMSALKKSNMISEINKINMGYKFTTWGDSCVYIHCRGGVGRTGTIMACYYAQMMKNPTLDKVLEKLRHDFSDMPKSAYRETPETQEQIDFIKRFIDDSGKQYKENISIRVQDCIRGSLMAGAAGDALGYTVEFMSRNTILSKYGANGITEFKLNRNGKALISDDTQMTLFTANAILTSQTVGERYYAGGDCLTSYIEKAYLDWYYTQTGKERELHDNYYYPTWLRALPEMAHRRAPSNICLSACKSLLKGKEVRNKSKGCGGIMRVAPVGLLNAAAAHLHGWSKKPLQKMAVTGAYIANVTHKHPLGYLPAALLTVLVYKLVPLSVREIKDTIDDIIHDTINVLDDYTFVENENDKQTLKQISERAVRLAHSDTPDAVAIRELGEGWTGEKAWAIALYCSLRHIDSMRDAIIAAVNHDGDSDSTGSITGNIMGAIYGYEAIKAQNLFCPAGHSFEETIELSEIILALADDLYTGCIIGEYDPIGTPEKCQWYERYCEMKPVGIGGKKSDRVLPLFDWYW